MNSMAGRHPLYLEILLEMNYSMLKIFIISQYSEYNSIETINNQMYHVH